MHGKNLWPQRRQPALNLAGAGASVLARFGRTTRAGARGKQAAAGVGRGTHQGGFKIFFGLILLFGATKGVAVVHGVSRSLASRVPQQRLLHHHVMINQ